MKLKNFRISSRVPLKKKFSISYNAFDKAFCVMGLLFIKHPLAHLENPYIPVRPKCCESGSV